MNSRRLQRNFLGMSAPNNIHSYDFVNCEKNTKEFFLSWCAVNWRGWCIYRESKEFFRFVFSACRCGGNHHPLVSSCQLIAFRWLPLNPDSLDEFSSKTFYFSTTRLMHFTGQQGSLIYVTRRPFKSFHTFRYYKTNYSVMKRVVTKENCERKPYGDIKQTQLQREESHKKSRKKIPISQFTSASTVSKTPSAQCKRNVTRLIKIMICEK